MTKPLRVYVGYDPIDDRAFKVCEHTLREHASIPVEVIPIWDLPLRKAGIYSRPYRVSDGAAEGEINGQMYDLKDGKPFSTAFSFARFGLVELELRERDGADWVVFLDADMLWRADIAELLAATDTTKSLCCVQHNYQPTDTIKMYGCQQQRYSRKNWSSVMVLRPDRCRDLDSDKLNNWSGSRLHGFEWLDDSEIGSLSEEWNWLEGWSAPEIDPKIVHFTRGTPDMEGHENVPYAEDWWAAYHAAIGEESKARQKIPATVE